MSTRMKFALLAIAVLVPVVSTGWHVPKSYFQARHNSISMREFGRVYKYGYTRPRLLPVVISVEEGCTLSRDRINAWSGRPVVFKNKTDCLVIIEFFAHGLVTVGGYIHLNPGETVSAHFAAASPGTTCKFWARCFCEPDPDAVGQPPGSDEGAFEWDDPPPDPTQGPPN